MELHVAGFKKQERNTNDISDISGNLDELSRNEFQGKLNSIYSYNINSDNTLSIAVIILRNAYVRKIHLKNV